MSEGPNEPCTNEGARFGRLPVARLSPRFRPRVIRQRSLGNRDLPARAAPPALCRKKLVGSGRIATLGHPFLGKLLHPPLAQLRRPTPRGVVHHRVADKVGKHPKAVLVVARTHRKLERHGLRLDKRSQGARTTLFRHRFGTPYAAVGARGPVVRKMAVVGVVQQCSESPHVRAGLGASALVVRARIAAKRLGRLKPEAAGHLALDSWGGSVQAAPCGIRLPSVAEIDEPHPRNGRPAHRFDRDPNVARMQIAVRHTGALHCKERLDQLPGKLQRLARRQGSDIGPSQSVKRPVEAHSLNVGHKKRRMALPVHLEHAFAAHARRVPAQTIQARKPVILPVPTHLGPEKPRSPSNRLNPLATSVKPSRSTAHTLPYTPSAKSRPLILPSAHCPPVSSMNLAIAVLHHRRPTPAPASRLKAGG